MVEEENMTKVVEWKGKPYLEIQPEGAKYPMRLSLWKAKVVLENIVEIRAFTDKYRLNP